MATSKEELEARVKLEGEAARERYHAEDNPSASVSWCTGVRPIVTRIVELEDELEDVRRELGADDGEGPVSAARRVVGRLSVLEGTLSEQKRGPLTGSVIEAVRSVLSAGDEESTPAAARRLISERDDARQAADQAHRENDALRAQVAALEAINADHERRISEACADVRDEERRAVAQLRIEHASTSIALERAVVRTARLETTVEELSRMMGRRAG